MSSSPHPLPNAGSTLAQGRYLLTAVIGEGASAAVYEATDTALDLQRAVKVLRPGPSRTDDQRRRLRAEARTLSELGHPNILRMYDFGAEGSYDYVVMQLASGGSLSDKLHRDGPLPPAEAVGYTLQILAGLAHAHERGIIHRDIKPQNILLDQDGIALVADFGIALVSADDARATRTGVAMGTLAFMAPEQRLDARSVGPRADIYAVAATLYNLLTDDTPVDLFAAPPHSTRWRGLEPRLVGIIQQAVGYDPSERYESAGAMAADLISVMEALEGRAELPRTFAEASERAATYLTENTGVTLAPPGAPKNPVVSEAATLPRPEPEPLAATEPLPPATQSSRAWWAVPAVLLLLALGLWFASNRDEAPAGAAQVPEPVVTAPPEPVAAPVPDPAPEPADIVEPDVPEPGPTAAPKPKKPKPKPKPTSTRHLPLPFGNWLASARGRTLTVLIDGTPEALTGELVSEFKGSEVRTRFTGSYHADSGVLEWHDEDVDDAMDVFLTRNGDGFSGEYTYRNRADKGLFELIERR
ncbi:MAG: serine/threonine protein kinase [Deltaproteobacteria bacterium]|nr:MAG: serine/threonine protein kinase [Deltaproteobacteria bacterium]